MDLALNNLQRLICHKTQPTIDRLLDRSDFHLINKLNVDFFPSCGNTTEWMHKWMLNNA